MFAQTQISRRGLFLGLATTASIQLWEPLKAFATFPADSLAGLPRIDRRASPDMPEVDEYFPGIRTHEKASLLMQYANVLQNRTGKPVRALAVRWAIGRGSGASAVMSHYLARGSKTFETHHERRHAIAGRKTIVNPNDAFIVTPAFLLSSSAWTRIGNNTGKSATVLIDKALRQNQKIYQRCGILPGSVVEANASAQVAIFHAGQYVSTEDSRSKDHLFRQFFQRRRGEQDEAHSLLKLIASGATADQVLGTLHDRMTKIKSTGGRTGTTRFYGHARHNFARRISEDIRTRGIEQTSSLLSAILSMPRLAPKQIPIV